MKLKVKLSAKETEIISSAILHRSSAITFRVDDVSIRQNILCIHPLDFLDVCEFMSANDTDDLTLRRLTKKIYNAVTDSIINQLDEYEANDKSKYLALLSTTIPYGIKLKRGVFFRRKFHPNFNTH